MPIDREKGATGIRAASMERSAGSLDWFREQCAFEKVVLISFCREKTH
jgi:hypothetical protein